MKSFNNGVLLNLTLFIKISALVLISYTFFYLGNHWSDGYQQLIFFDSRQSDKSTSISISPNANKTFDLSSLISDQNDLVSDQTLTIPSNSSSTASSSENSEPSVSPPLPLPLSPPPLPPPPPRVLPPPPPRVLPPPPPATVEIFGIVDENGTMMEEFEVGGLDLDLVENWGNENENGEEEKSGGSRIRFKRFPLCPNSMREYIPCLDNSEEIRKLKSTNKGENYERHCPREGQSLNCLVPAPKGYRTPIPWPKSRDEIWFSNVPHTRLVDDKGGQNWILRQKNKFKFPGGGTQFIHGADHYLDQISQMVPDIAFGCHTRVSLDVGCGVASFGAFLLSRNVITLSVAPKDVHENQIQFALERGVPAMVAVFSTHRLLYPSQGFDLIHCSRCRIDWTRDDGILLLEVNRMLRAGGYFAWAAQPVYKHEEPLQEQWKEMEDLTRRLCWELVKKEGYIAIWRKPLNNICYENRDAGVQPPLCELDDDPDNVWYVNLKACISRLPENGYGANIPTWPARLHNPPDRLQTIQMDAYTSRNELFKAESKYWNEIVWKYIRVFRWKKLKLRNVMDMKASFGGFAAALIDQQMDCWTLNVVPVSGPNTLPVIYDRGLLGVMHDWCEPFDTYPRTYDLLHSAGLFSTEQKRCNISSIMLEMDRMLRPGGRVYIRDSVSIMDEAQDIARALGWVVRLADTAEGPHASWKDLICEKRLLRS